MEIELTLQDVKHLESKMEDYAEDVLDEDCECAVCDCIEGEM